MSHTSVAARLLHENLLNQQLCSKYAVLLTANNQELAVVAVLESINRHVVGNVARQKAANPKVRQFGLGQSKHVEVDLCGTSADAHIH